MGPLAVAAFIIGAAFVANLAFDVGINAAQNWYDTVYTDAFWSYRVTDSPALRDLKREEVEIDRLMRGEDFVGEQPGGG